MKNGIEVLVLEHRIIEEALASLEAFLDSLGKKPELEREAVRDYARYFHELVDICHHGKEENYLFVKMNQHGFSREGGPVSAMLSEQDEGRDHLEALAAIGQTAGPLSLQERDAVRGHALGYIMRIRPHMSREEDILFPIVLHALPQFVLTELARDFDDFERNSLPGGFHQELERISKNLFAAYPPQKKV